MRKLLLFAPLLLVAVAAVNAGNMAPGIDISANSTYQGYVTWSDTIYFDAFTGVGTGDIIDFSNVHLGAGGAVWPRMGICVDDTATNITLTGLTRYTLTYMWVGAGGSVRVWCPDLGEPVQIDNGIMTNWDATYRVATITPTNEQVTLRWTGTEAAAETGYDTLIFGFNLISLAFGVGLFIFLIRSGEPNFEAVILYIIVVVIIYVLTQLGIQVISRLS